MAGPSLLKCNNKSYSKESNAKIACLFLAGAGFFRNKKGDISLGKISLLILGVFLLVGFIYFVSALQSISSVTLNSTASSNTTVENLTAYPQPFNSSQKYIYDWRVGGESIALLNMPFEEEGGCDGDACDFSSFGNNATVNGGSVFLSTGGHDGFGAYEFDGVNDYVEIDYSQDFNFTNGEGFTVMAWINPNDLVNNEGDIVSHYRGAVDYRAWILQIDNGKARFVGCSNGTSDSCEYAYSGVEVNDTATWYHLVGTWNGTHLQVYVNGVAEASTPPALANIHSTSDTGIRIGRDTATEWYNGTIDDVLIFNRTLSDEQISAIYNNNTDLIVSGETDLEETWSVLATPAYNNETGLGVLSNDLAIVGTEIGSVFLNTTDSFGYGQNGTWENLTAYSFDVVPSDSKVLYDWRRDGNSIILINAPFDGDINRTGNVSGGQFTKDYSQYNEKIYKGTTASVYNDPIYNATGGYDGKGAYEFPSIDNDTRLTIVVSQSNLSSITDELTVAYWTKTVESSLANNNTMFQHYVTDTNRWHIYQEDSTNHICIFNDISNSGDIYCNPSFVFPIGDWIHVAISIDDKDWRVYLRISLGHIYLTLKEFILGIGQLTVDLQIQ